MNQKHASECDLVKSLWAGDAQAWEVFMKQYDAGMVEVIRRAMGRAGVNAEEVDRLAQMLRVKLLRHGRVLLKFDPQRGPFAAFLAGIARHWVRYQFRKPGRRKLKQLPLRVDVAQPPVWDGTDEAGLKECVAILSPNDQEWLWSRFDSGATPSGPLSARDRQRWHRILVRLKNHLANQGA